MGLCKGVHKNTGGLSPVLILYKHRGYDGEGSIVSAEICLLDNLFEVEVVRGSKGTRLSRWGGERNRMSTYTYPINDSTRTW